MNAIHKEGAEQPPEKDDLRNQNEQLFEQLAERIEQNRRLLAQTAEMENMRREAKYAAFLNFSAKQTARSRINLTFIIASVLAIAFGIIVSVIFVLNEENIARSSMAALLGATAAMIGLLTVGYTIMSSFRISARQRQAESDMFLALMDDEFEETRKNLQKLTSQLEALDPHEMERKARARARHEFDRTDLPEDSSASESEDTREH